jgi:hypothetical protein
MVLGTPIQAEFNISGCENILITGEYLAIDENNNNIINFYADYFDTVNDISLLSQKTAYNYTNGEWQFIKE